VYGAVEGRLNEQLPLNPVNPYGRTKKMIEEMLADFSAAYGTRYVSLRYFNASGADSSGQIGEMHEPENHLIPRLLENALDPTFEMQIFGDKHPTKDGTCIRDYIHVEDLAEAHILAMDYLLKGGKSDVFNLGTAQGSSVMDVIKMVEQVSKKKLQYKVVGPRAGDPPALIADSSKIERVLGWKPKRDLQEIVGSAWSWIQKRPR
jgi:UDP-glucose 4-epimerase